ncbi:uncharacterized protein ACRADG_000323 [Cochliomyia hominivorax]
MSPPPRRLQITRPSETSTDRQLAPRRPNWDCRICKKNHPLRKCYKFKRMSVQQRRTIVRQHKYCYNCLAHSHRVYRCKSRERCKICVDNHHTLLHYNVDKRQTNRKKDKTNANKSSNISSSKNSPEGTTIVINVNTKR